MIKHVPAGAEPTQPKTIAQDRDAISAGLLLFGEKAATQHRLRTKQREKRRGYPRSLHPLRRETIVPG